jgi:inactivated superfamily I helicase
LNDLKQVSARGSSFLQTLAAVLWSFFGVRKCRDHERDMASLNPVHVIITGVLAGALFVVSLVVLVRFILG